MGGRFTKAGRPSIAEDFSTVKILKPGASKLPLVRTVLSGAPAEPFPHIAPLSLLRFGPPDCVVAATAGVPM